MTLFARPVRLTQWQLLSTKITVHVLLTGYLALLFYAGVTDNLGADPVKALIHTSGISSLKILFITLLVSPLASLLPCGDVIKLRRMLGIYAFVYALSHFLAYIAFELQFEWSQVVSEIIARPYITVGFAALIILTLLTLTSPTVIRRKMGRRWQTLHNFIFVAGFLIIVHYWWSLKGIDFTALTYAAIGLVLLLLRKNKLRRLIR
ncbi:sulfite oxidase heme-binding subunit YedZ [Alteromonas ponticola]|uniref:Protein-methionine-sulfoxide reductase heme-binding subunit MsrQ n=1 Tax=Alteromonas ponticola TaxID=2720613 RepID=A0ABX1R061_9ALTE|nr:protein-methionine-sulfoxide reductase heme-binding subunit MsrQ [Alteromonas ponticola]NMH58663.1 sulfoxide reductase heme-binding subunit YedZ [Alteromonas ponticola]